MKTFAAIFSAVALLASAISALATPDGVEPLRIGAAAPNFDLPGIDDQNHKLGDYASADVLAVLFTCNHCPTAQAVEGRVKQLVEDHKGKSFQLVAISPNDAKSVRIDELGYSVYDDSLESMKLHAKDEGFNFPYLYDGDTQEATMAYGALATPHIFIFDKDRKLRYQGRIDESKYADGATQLDARNAIGALLAGEPVPVETTRAFGCSTKWLYKRDEVGKKEEEWKRLPVTYEKIDAAGVAKLAKNDTNKLRMINLWATWCGPCVAEFPDLVLLGRQFESRGFDFISICMDDPDQAEPVQRFLEDQHAAMPPRTAASVEREGRKTNNYLNTVEDVDDLAEVLDPEWQGPAPYTLIIAPGGEIIFRHEGEIDVIEARRVILGHFGKFYTKE